MKEWQDSSQDVTRTFKDKGKAKSLFNMLKEREESMKSFDAVRFPSLSVESYYEIIKEAITALMAVDGYKTLSHEVLVGYLKYFHKEFSEYEITFIVNLRKIRNRINYDGFNVPKQYLDINKQEILAIIAKLKNILESKLKCSK